MLEYQESKYLNDEDSPGIEKILSKLFFPWNSTLEIFLHWKHKIPETSDISNAIY